MKTECIVAPEKIWLQIDPEAEPHEGFDGLTWCQDQINDTDAEYVLAAVVESLRQKLGIVSSLLREASGRMSYGHWSTEFRARVERSLKTKVKGY